MRDVRCQRCGHMFTLARDLVDAALQELEETEQDYYTLECLRCRHVIKIQRSDLERMRPPEGADS
ncbi:MAG: hypothetical protein JW900_12020 [Anaerolineae bacterium]|nr:hypothetical protein [Anaerolineae bacterium]